MRTIIELFEKSVEKYSNNPLMWEHNGTDYQSTSYSDIKKDVYRFAAGLMALGLKKGDRVGLVAEGRNDWLISELGILYAGGINVPMSVKLDAENDLQFRIKHSEARMVIVSEQQLPKIRQIKDECPNLETIIVLDSIKGWQKDEIHKLVIYDKGDELIATNKQTVDQMIDSIEPNDKANISYTSGTTSDPKGIILSHLNYSRNVQQASSVMLIPQNYITLAVLPWDHSFAHTACLYSFIYFGASIASVQLGKTPMETLRNIPKNINEIRPHVMMSVPALAKNFKKNIESGIHAKGSKVEKLFNKALATAYKYNGLGFDKGKGSRILLKPLVKLYDKLLFKKIRDGFGGRLEFFIGGGALLDVELQKFFYAIGIPMLQGYGLSEASPIISANALFKHKLGSSGFLVDNLELKIIDDNGTPQPTGTKGEIVVKGENVMLGYWKNENATKETLRDGWLHTGDLGYIDKDEFLYVQGRFKSLLISADGEKYSPEGIEEAFVEKSELIDQAMLHNNQDPYTVALIVPNKMALLRRLKEKGLAPNSTDGAEAALLLIQEEINHFRPGNKYADMFPSRWMPASIAVLSETFNEENKLMNSTMKIVRDKITHHFEEEMKFLYTPAAKKIINDINIKHINKIIS